MPRTSGSPPAELSIRYGRRIARLLAARGISTLDEAERFLDPGLHRLSSPFEIPRMEQAASRIAEAVRRGESIWVYGDYDVDGQTSAALLARVLKDLGGRVSTYIPNRMEEGYGLNAGALGRLKAAGASLVVTVDCGITALTEAAWARENGLDLVITDHHQPGPELPQAIAVVNPKLGASSALRELAGCGVAFKLAEAVAERLGAGRSLAHEYVELAAVGTVADVVPLTGENRSIVRAGLERMNRSPRIPGLAALKDVAGIEGDVTAGHIGFGLGPRLNAAGRIADASAGVALLLAEDYEEALPLARRLDAENEERRRIERRIADEADRFVVERCDPGGDRALVAWSEGWHPGVIGIAAARLVERYYRPTVILAVEGELARGSGRSIPGLNLYEALSECADLFEAFGGHEGAAGLTIKSERLDEFAHRFKEAVEKRIGPGDLVPVLEYDDVVDAGELTLEFAEAIERMRPFGVANPAPVFVCRRVRLSGRAVGKDGAHLKLSVVSEETRAIASGIGFGMAESVGRKLEPGALYDVACELEINEWNGKRTPSLQVQDVRIAQGESPLAKALRGVSEAAAAADPGGSASGGERLDDWRVVDWRGKDREGVFASLASAGMPAYVIPGPGSRACARAIAELGYAERTAVVDDGVAGDVPREVARVLELPGWIAVVPTPPGPAAAQVLTKALAGVQQIAVVLWDFPPDVRELAAHAGVIRRSVAAAEFHLAFDRQGNAARLERIARRFPDRERLGRLYVALSGIGEGRAFGAERAYEALERKWPGFLDREGVERAIEIFAELGLVEAWAGGYRLLARPLAKVDLGRSLRYNECTRIRDLLVRSQMALEDSPPDQFMSRLWELARSF